MNHVCFRTSLFSFLFILLSGCNRNPSTEFVPVKSASSDKGMVVTAHHIASEIGLDILKEGGNAAEASIAVQFALAVVYPRAGNIGGGGFLVYRDQAGEVTTLDFREKAPIDASRDMYLDTLGNIIPNLSLQGVLASGVPGTVAGLEATYKKYGGTMEWSKLVKPSIDLALHGFTISESEAQRLNLLREEFIAENGDSMPFVKPTPWKKGDLLIQKALAGTLEMIAQHGKDGFYKGSTADRLVALMQKKEGLISHEDLNQYEAVWRPPVVNEWRGNTIYSMGLPSSGGIVLGQILKMLDPLLQDTIPYHETDVIHLVVEAEKRAYADRAKFLGDSDFYPVDKALLLSDTYLEDKMASFDPAHATASKTLIETPIIEVKEHFETTHLSITDQYGNAASVTTTLNGNFGCKVWVPEAGFFLNNEMDDFSAKHGVPNDYGLIGGDANAIAPTKRMLSSMTPTILEKGDRLFMVLGTPGGSTIITSVLQIILNVTSFEMNIHDAVQAPRYHHQGFPDEIIFEDGGIDPTVLDRLSLKGHALKPVNRIGLVEAILVDESGTMHGAADHRGEDHCAGW